LRSRVRDGRRIVGVGVGCGLSARCAEAAHADVIGLYNSAPLRLAGRGSLAGLLATGNANAMTLALAEEVRPCVSSTPLVAGLLGADHARPTEAWLEDLGALDIAGVQNSPTAGLITGSLRASLEETDLGYAAEVELIRRAHRAGFLTCAYVFTPDETRQMLDAGVDVVVAHLGLTAGGFAGARTALAMDQAVKLVEGIAGVLVQQATEAILCAHGGPIAGAADFAELIRRLPEVRGFFGASTFERLPIERAVTDAVREFTEMQVPA
jgi:predicted TIM-barrel enzyme